ARADRGDAHAGHACDGARLSAPQGRHGDARREHHHRSEESRTALMFDGWMALAAAAEGSALAVWVRSSTWGYPAVESIHIWGLAVLVGTAVAFDLRLLGVSSRLPVDALAHLLLPCARIAFAVALVSGLVLFSTSATTFAVQPLFYVKMGAIAVAVINTTLFHRGIGRSMEGWNVMSPTPAAARGAAIVSLAAWTCALVCGRWLAYV